MTEKTIKIVLFDCRECPKKNAQSVKAEIARRGICRTCRIKFNKVAKNQLPMFEEPAAPVAKSGGHAVRL